MTKVINCPSEVVNEPVLLMWLINRKTSPLAIEIYQQPAPVTWSSKKKKKKTQKNNKKNWMRHIKRFHLSVHVKGTLGPYCDPA